MHQPPSFKSDAAIDLLRGLGVDVFIVAAYGLILPPAALGLPRHGCLNIHASLLPRWRGAAPIQAAILAGDAETGVSIMRMESGLDTGPVCAMQRLPIMPQDTAQSLGDRLASLGAAMIVDALIGLSSAAAAATPQAAIGVCYAPKIAKSAAAIDWRADAASLERRIRAFNPWPIAETCHRGEQLRVWEAAIAPGFGPAQPPPAAPGTVLAVSKLGIDVACGRGALRITRLQRAGRQALDARSFAAAASLVGVRFGAP